MSLVVSHNYGFFSCCSVKLESIVTYINDNNNIPEYVDSSNMFNLYKINPDEDITYHMFRQPDGKKFKLTDDKINFINTHQFTKYSDLDFKNISKVLKKYFEPSGLINRMANNFIKAYNINRRKTVVLYYRGTDKHYETTISSFDRFSSKLEDLLSLIKDESVHILIQTDSAQFLDYINGKNYKNRLIIIKELEPSYNHSGVHYERTATENYRDIKFLLAILCIMSRCKYVICSSSNVSLWLMLYRGHSDNVYQILDDCWL